MPYHAEILADNVSPQGHRLTSMLTEYPRMVHSEHLRHRAFSYSVASSRALPTKALIERVQSDPVLPVYWGKYDRGMGAKEELTGKALERAKAKWLRARDRAVDAVEGLLDLSLMTSSYDEPFDSSLDRVGLSKELCNRILEPWMWVTCVVTGTDAAWANFFWLRCHSAAQPEMRQAAVLMEQVYTASTPRKLRNGTWHMPFVRDEDWDDADVLLQGESHYNSPGDRMAELNAIQELLKKVSAARCARTSYLTHDGRKALSEDAGLFERLLEGAEQSPEQPSHLSPTEHVATPIPEGAYLDRSRAWDLPAVHMRHGVDDLKAHWNRYGNLEGWMSMRYLIPDENGVAPYRRRLATEAEVQA